MTTDKLAQSLLARRRIDVQTGCWLWTGALDGKGYGMMRWGRMVRRVHLYAAHVWLEIPLENGWKISRTCGNRRCFAPRHLIVEKQKMTISTTV